MGDEDMNECWSCRELRHVSENGLCTECKNEVRTVDDTWLVQEFRKRYSDDEANEAIDQMWLALLNERGKSHDQQIALEAKVSVLKQLTSQDRYTNRDVYAQKLISDCNELLALLKSKQKTDVLTELPHKEGTSNDK